MNQLKWKILEFRFPWNKNISTKDCVPKYQQSDRNSENRLVCDNITVPKHVLLFLNVTSLDDRRNCKNILWMYFRYR